MNKLPFDANDYLNFELNEDFIDTTGEFMNDYGTQGVLNVLLKLKNQDFEKPHSPLTIHYEEEEEEDIDNEEEENTESHGNEDFEDIDENSNFISTAATSVRSSFSAGSIKKSRSVISLDSTTEEPSCISKDTKHPEDIQIDLSSHFSDDNSLTLIYQSFSSQDIKTPTLVNETEGDVAILTDLTLENIESLLMGLNPVEEDIVFDDEEVNVMNINFDKGMCQ